MTTSLETAQVDSIQPESTFETHIPDELVLRAQQGDEAAREQTMGLSIPIALRAARRFASEPVQVEDIAYGGLEKVYKYGLVKGSYNAPGNFNGWVKRVVQNTGIDFYRRGHSLEQFSVEPDSYMISDVVEPHGVEQSAELNSGIEEVQTLVALAGVKKEFADPFILYHVDGYSYDEIAAILGVGMTTIRTRIHRAKKQLELHKTLLREVYNSSSV